MARQESFWRRESDMLASYVIDAVIEQSKEHFLDEGCPEDILHDLHDLWQRNLEDFHAAQQRSIQQKAPHRPPSLPATESDSQIGQPSDSDAQNASGVSVETNPEEITEADDEPGVQDVEELFDTENIAVCQYKRVVHKKNNYKLQLASGIMTVNDRDYVFAECTGEANW